MSFKTLKNALNPSFRGLFSDYFIVLYIEEINKCCYFCKEHKKGDHHHYTQNTKIEIFFSLYTCLCVINYIGKKKDEKKNINFN